MEIHTAVMIPDDTRMAATIACRNVCVEHPASTVVFMNLMKLPPATTAMLAGIPIIGYTVLASLIVQTLLASVQKSTDIMTVPQSSANA